MIARGGGSVEDLLPFSNESLVRAVAAARTPVVSAIGHETDVPLLDLVADLAASTPTDAAKRIVPDLADELRRLAELRDRARTAVQRRLTREARAHGRPARPAPSRRADTGFRPSQSRSTRCVHADAAACPDSLAAGTRRPCAPASADARALTASHPRPWLRGRPHRGRDGGARTRPRPSVGCASEWLPGSSRHAHEAREDWTA